MVDPLASREPKGGKHGPSSTSGVDSAAVCGRVVSGHSGKFFHMDKAHVVA
jgi:hypothetical protein